MEEITTNQPAMQPKKHPQRKSRILAGLILVLTLSFLVAIYAPLELYFTNIDEFSFDFYAMMPQLLKLFGLLVVAGCAGLAICYMLYERLYDLVLLIGGAGYVIAYIHGMFMVGNLPPLDGTSIDWALYTREDVISTVICAIVIVVFVLLTRFLHMKRMRKLISGLTLFFTAILAVTGVTVGISSNGFQHKPQAVVTKNAEYQMSEDQNMVVFVLDAFDSWTMRHLMETDDPEFADILEDFTYYPNTVGAYAFTQHSIPYILTGQWFENQESFTDYTAKAMAASPLLQELKNRNYRVGLYEEELSCGDKQTYDFENVEHVALRFTSFSGFAKQELKLVWFKYAPFRLKRLAKIDMGIFKNIVEPENGSELFHYNNTDFYTDAKNAEVTTVSEKCFKFIHIEGAHVPFRYDKNVNVISEDQGNYDQNVEAGMTILKQYLDNLKEAGVYDNTAIVVLADHGYGAYWDDGILGRSNPLLAVKGVGEKHAMNLSEAPISYADLQECFRRLLDGKSSDQVFDAKEGQQRSRRYMAYHYLKEGHMEEYEQQGNAIDLGTMLPTGRVFEAEDYQP